MSIYHVSFSDRKNYIQVTIPSIQKPPFWATKYKFVIKPSTELYETIYTNIFFTDSTTGETYFLLEGENQRKVEVGDRYIVKLDSQGPLLRCAYATVLEKEAKETDFLDPLPQDSLNNDISLPAGTYMKMKAQDFSVQVGDDPFILPGKSCYLSGNRGKAVVGAYRGLSGYPDDAGIFSPPTIPSGTRIKIDFDSTRRGFR